MELIKPKEVILKDLDDNEHTFIISRFDVIAGREIITQYPTANMPKMGEYQRSEALMKKCLSYAAVNIDGQEVRLSTAALINAHVADSTLLLKLEFAIMEYNTNFFGQGSKSGFLSFLIKKCLGELLQRFPMLTDFLQRLSQKKQ